MKICKDIQILDEKKKKLLDKKSLNATEDLILELSKTSKEAISHLNWKIFCVNVKKGFFAEVMGETANKELETWREANE